MRTNAELIARVRERKGNATEAEDCDCGMCLAQQLANRLEAAQPVECEGGLSPARWFVGTVKPDTDPLPHTALAAQLSRMLAAYDEWQKLNSLDVFASPERARENATKRNAAFAEWQKLAAEFCAKQ